MGGLTWKAVEEKYSKDEVSVKKLTSLVETLPPLKLGNQEESKQGWFTGKGKTKTVHQHVEAFVNHIKSTKALLEAGQAVAHELPNHTEIILGPSDDSSFNAEELKLAIAGDVHKAETASSWIPKLEFVFGSSSI